MLSIKDILPHVIIKQKSYADRLDKILENEGYEVTAKYLEYKTALSNTDTLYTYTFDYHDLSEFTHNQAQLAMMTRTDGTAASAIYKFLTESQIEKLLRKKRTSTVTGYIEYNPYYRELLGLPPLKKTEYIDDYNVERIVYTEDKSKFYYVKTQITGVDVSKPVHTWTIDQKSLLSNYKFTDKEIEDMPYLKNIAKGMDIVTLRDAGPFEMVWTNIRRIESMTKLLPFLDNYRLVLRHYLANHYSEYDVVYTRNYEKLQCILLFLATLANVNARYIVNRQELQLPILEIYDLYSSFGLPKYKFTPKYLNILANNLNDLIYKKGTNINLHNITDLFHDIKLYKYFVIKTVNPNIDMSSLYEYEMEEVVDETGATVKRPKMSEYGTPIKKLNSMGMPVMVEDYEDKLYTLKYVKTPILADSPYPYIDDDENIYNYEDIVNADDKWGSPSNMSNINYEPDKERPANFVEDHKLERLLTHTNFSYAESKYLGLDATINLGWMSMKIAMLYRWFVDNKDATNNPKYYNLYFEYADVDATVYELMLYLQCLIFYKYRRVPSIPDTMSSYFKLYTLSNKVNVDEIKGVITNVYRHALIKIKNVVDHEFYQKDAKNDPGVADKYLVKNYDSKSYEKNIELDKKIKMIKDNYDKNKDISDVINTSEHVLKINDFTKTLLHEMTLTDLNYVMNEYFDKRPVHPYLRNILDNVLWLYQDPATEKKMIMDKSFYRGDNNIDIDERLLTTEENPYYFEELEEYHTNLANDVSTVKYKHNSKILSVIDFLTHKEDVVMNNSGNNQIVDRENVDPSYSTDIRMYNNYSKFEKDLDIIDFLYRLRENTTDYRDYEMINTILTTLTTGDKLTEQFIDPKTNKADTNLLDHLIHLNDKNIAFARRIDELSEDQENYQSSFDTEIMEVIQLIRRSVIEKNHSHAHEAFEFLQKTYTDNEVLRYLEQIIDFFKSYTQDFINHGVEYILDNGNNIVHLLEDMHTEISRNDWDLGSLFLLMSSYPTEILQRIRNVISPAYTIYTSERLEVYLPALEKFVELSSDGIFLT